ncbi:MAG: cyclic nucleotide-binding domain-containing protein [Candidatus Hydrogenedentes bacterium]|nr:cyclic nucleotide-binding domain-containing protein [Candidatus Hydrogenedentota bacterium]
MSFRDKYIRLVHTMDLFQELDPEDLMKIMSMGLTEAVHKGTVVFKKGSTGEKMYVILEGKVNVVDEGEVIATLGKGEMFGEMALLSPEVRSATAVAEESSSFFVLTTESLQELFTKRIAIRLLLNIIGKLSQRLRKTNELLAQREQGGNGS